MHKKFITIGITAILLLTVSYTYALEQKDILVFYSFDILDGNMIKDESGKNHDAELVGNGELVDGEFNKAIHLTGGVVHLSNANDVVKPISENGEFTLAAWFYLNSHANYDGIVSIEVPGGDCCEFRMMVDPNFKPFWDAAHHVDRKLDNFTFELNKWFHYVLVADGKDGKIFVNGEFVGSQQENFEFPNYEEASVFIGAGESLNSHKVEDALIDEVAIYSKALTEKEVQSSMELGVKGALAVEAEHKLALTWGQLKSENK